MKIQSKILKDLENSKLINVDNVDDFILMCKRYIRCLKSGKLIFSVKYYNNTGYTVNIKSMAKSMFLGFGFMLDVLEYKFNDKYNGFEFATKGCGVNYDTNRQILKDLKSLGFINQKQLEILQQLPINSI